MTKIQKRKLAISWLKMTLKNLEKGYFDVDNIKVIHRYEGGSMTRQRLFLSCSNHKDEVKRQRKNEYQRARLQKIRELKENSDAESKAKK